MDSWIAAALTAVRAQTPCALISVLAVEGSAPREAGTRMLATASEAFGTIGGGKLEYTALEQARAALKQPPGTWRIQDFPLGPLLGQCCGGRVRLMIEHLDLQDCAWLNDAKAGGVVCLETQVCEDRVQRTPTEAPPTNLRARGPMLVAGDRFVETVGEAKRGILLFGAGHVGQAIAKLMPGLPFHLTWFDTRAEAKKTGAEIVSAETAIAAARQATDLVLILTHDHGLDYALTAAALHSPAAFIGLIGSRSKGARFISRLSQAGVAPEDLRRIVCPIGLPGIIGKAPEVIAVSVTAQVLQLCADPPAAAPALAPPRFREPVPS